MLVTWSRWTARGDISSPPSPLPHPLPLMAVLTVPSVTHASCRQGHAGDLVEVGNAVTSLYIPYPLRDGITHWVTGALATYQRATPTHLKPCAHQSLHRKLNSGETGVTDGRAVSHLCNTL